MTMNRNLGFFQLGKETVPGTLVPATEKIAVEDDLQFSDDNNVISRPNLRRGTLSRHPGNETATKRGVVWTIPDTPLNFEQFRHFLAMGIKGGVAAVSVIPSPAGRYSRTYERSLTAIEALDTYTIERRASDGSTNKDVRVPYCFATKITLKGSQDNPATYAVEGIGRAPDYAGPITPALVLPSLVVPSSYLSAIYMDNAWSGRGGTLVSDQVIGWQIDIYTGWFPFTALQGRTALDFATIKVNPDNVGMDVTVTALVGAQYTIEQAAARAMTERFVQMKIADDPTTSGRSLAINMALKHEADDILAFGNQDGQLTVDFKMVDTADNGAHLLEAILVNYVP